ncbi:MAG: DUF2254 domain-containing protein [Gammaproteobacteria bacterium]|nr:DUF2254 domain-containing protein [Gammaproteobacteria bacterium]
MPFKLMQWLRRLASSYWFIPASMALWSVGMAALLLYVDNLVETGERFMQYLPLVNSPSGARTLLATIAGSAISVAGVVFSITIVVLNMASAQFGPRLLRNFMEKAGTQVVLGAFLGTFIYCLIVLGFVREAEPQPVISTAVGMVLGINSFVLLIYFIHMVSVSIQASQIINDVAARMQDIMRATFPEREETAATESTPDEESENLEQRVAEEGAAIPAETAGYLQAIDRERLLEIAMRDDRVIRIPLRPGHFVMRGETLASVLPPEKATDLAGEIHAAIRIGNERSSLHDPEFAIHQLVEVALRALSPGINDPYTAINCIDRLGAMLADLARRQLPSRYLRDKNGRRRVVGNPFTYAGMVDAAFDQLRQQADGNAAVMFRILEVLTRLGELGGPEPFMNSLRNQLQAIGSESRDDFRNPVDQQGYAKRYKAAQEILAGPAEQPG